MNKWKNMKFCVTPTSQFRSLANVEKFHFEGSMKNWGMHRQTVVDLIIEAMAEGVVLEIGSFEDTPRSSLFIG